MGRELSYDEFKDFYTCIDERGKFSKEKFEEEFIKKYTSTNEGLTLWGLKKFFED